MSSIRERLQRMGVTLGPSEEQKREEPAKPARPIEDVVEGTVAETEEGSCFLVENRWALEERHGGVPLATLLNHWPETVAGLAKDKALAGANLEKAAFVDTETSGLAGGTGTFAFLVGVGTIQNHHFVLRQFFLRALSEEPAMIAALDAVLGEREVVVSFNGKTFDVPLLQTRFTLARRRFPLADAPHFDVLFAARRLWSARLESCALTSLEEHVLGLVRDDDVPSWLIPQMYFDYARSGDARPLQPVFSHNAYDILSLVALSARLCDVFRDPFGEAAQHGTDLYSVGKLYEELGQVEEAKRAYRAALESPLPFPIRDRTQRRLSFLYKRQKAWDEARAIWADLIGESGGQLYPYVELAKYFEHEQRDYEAALDIVGRAIEQVDRFNLQPRRGREQALDELHHRRGRLEGKLQKTTERKGNQPDGSPPRADEPS